MKKNEIQDIYGNIFYVGDGGERIGVDGGRKKERKWEWETIGAKGD